ncbi:MAG TPA: hypothetical protein VJB92_02595 [Candidatus Paceibacterota bacterium]
MKPLRKSSAAYFKELDKRAKKSRVHRAFQLIGLEIADLLHDRKHKSLYIKLAKKNNGQSLLILAKSVAEREYVKNKGAYFMRLFKIKKNENSHHRR